MSSFILEALRVVIPSIPLRFSEERWTDRTEKVSGVRERLLALREKKNREYDAIRAADPPAQS